nr:hypothetical protein [Tanacetum cinerariifolium]
VNLQPWRYNPLCFDCFTDLSLINCLTLVKNEGMVRYLTGSGSNTPDDIF